MKKLILFLSIFFGAVTLIYALTQSAIGKTLIENAIVNGLKKAGFEIQIERLEGTLPHQINLKNVTIDQKEFHIEIQELKLRPILWRLLKKEIAFSNIEAKNIALNEQSPFDFRGKLRISEKKIDVTGSIHEWNGHLSFHRKKQEAFVTFQNGPLFGKGKVFLTPEISSEIALTIQNRIFAQIHTEKETGKATWQIPHLNMTGEAMATLQERTLAGSFQMGPFAQGSFDLTLAKTGLITGSSEIDISNLQSFQIPDVYGKVQLKAEWSALEGIQGLVLALEGKELYYKNLFTQTLNAHANWENPFHGPKGPISFVANGLKTHHLELNEATFETVLQDAKAPFKLFAEGETLEFYIDGFWEENLFLEVDNLSGTYLSTPFELQEPISLEKTDDRFQLPKAKFYVGSGTAFFQIDREKENTDATFILRDIPLSLVSSLKGTFSLDVTLQEENGDLKGDLKADLKQTAPFISEGTFTGHFNHDRLKVKGALTPFIELDLFVPIHLSLWPFQAELLLNKEAEGKMAFNGRIEEILDFFDIGPHRLEGNCQAEFAFKNTLNRPLVEGKLIFDHGTYENYYSGTYLQNIQAECFAEKNILYLRKLTAEDRTSQGTLSAEGDIRLLQSELYPFRFHVTFNQLQFVEIDLVEAQAKGKLKIEGNTLSAVAKGDLSIEKCALTIPEHIPRPIPKLNVTYRHEIHPIVTSQKTYTPYPLHLDVKVALPADVSISGRGLSSLWKGEFHLGGTATALAAKGKLELKEGQFSFSSRNFKLTEGTLSLSGIEHQMPHLKLAATTETKGIQITARLGGPLDDPQITFQSSPPLPLGSIMSYLLFGQDISEIGGFEALQIASSLASLAGTGPDVMEDTRRSLGVDRLRVISDPDAEGGETLSIQVGKYVAKGVLVTLTQGTDETSTNISVEVELKNNFVFQIESDQRQEQGKFTLKWSRNY